MKTCMRSLRNNKIYVDRGFTIVEAVGLLQIWCKARKTQFLGKKYFQHTWIHSVSGCIEKGACALCSGIAGGCILIPPPKPWERK